MQAIKGRQTGNEVERVQYHVGGAVPVGLLEAAQYLPAFRYRNPFIRNGRSGDVAAQLLQSVALVGLTDGGGM